MTRSCRATTDLLSAWLDGEVTPDQAAACEQHLATCAECRAELAQLERARALLRALPEPVVPDGLAASIKLAAADELAREQPGLLWPAWATPLAAAAALVIAITVGQMLRAPSLVATDDIAAGPPPATILEPLGTAPTPSVEVAAPAVSAASEPAIAAVESEAGVKRVGHRRSVIARTHAVDLPDAPTAAAPAPAAAYALAADTASEGPLPADGARLPRTADSSEALELALAPRLTLAHRALAEPTPARAPSSLELELAGGVVAAMLVEDFIEEHLIESTPTLISVATGTPSADLGPRLVEGEDEAHFELCFTEAMRRALSGGGQ